VHAYAYVMQESARVAARRADEELRIGQYRGPLHGVPVGVKDVFATVDAPTEAGSGVLAGHQSRSDAALVERLRRAGALIVGKQTTQEFACGANIPATRNPWDLARDPGGSSMGSAVSVATGSAFASLATETAGSVRKPASLNGVTALVPTYGTMPLDGIISASPSLERIGILARDAGDVALVYDALAADHACLPSNLDRSQGAGGRPFRLGVESYFFGPELDGDVRRVVETALERLECLGCKLIRVEVPNVHLSFAIVATIFAVEAASTHLRWLRDRPFKYDPATRRKLEAGLLITATRNESARRVREVLRENMKTCFQDNSLDALVSPTLPIPAMTIDEIRKHIDSHVRRYNPYRKSRASWCPKGAAGCEWAKRSAQGRFRSATRDTAGAPMVPPEILLFEPFR